MHKNNIPCTFRNIRSSGSLLLKVRIMSFFGNILRLTAYHPSLNTPIQLLSLKLVHRWDPTYGVRKIAGPSVPMYKKFRERSFRIYCYSLRLFSRPWVVSWSIYFTLPCLPVSVVGGLIHNYNPPRKHAISDTPSAIFI